MLYQFRILILTHIVNKFKSVSGTVTFFGPVMIRALLKNTFTAFGELSGKQKLSNA